jgi:nitrite reductase/ring-hydroxylating ferredoxin subunit
MTGGQYSAVPYLATDPERIPAARYYDKAFFELECERVWPRTWQMACRLEMIPEVGDWAEYSNVGRSVVVVRTATGVKAFHNACRHRGVAFAGGSGQAHGNCAKSGFVCPFHGWRWTIDGKNTQVYGRHLFSERQLEEDDIDLVPCRVETWGGCAFINFDDNAPSFRETMGPVADRLEAHGVANMRSEWWFGTVLPANWKLAMEAFMEGYHVRTTHPQLEKIYPGMYASSYEDERAHVFGASSMANLIGNSQQSDSHAAIREQFDHMEMTGVGMSGMFHAKEIEIARELLDVDLPEDPREAVPIWFGIVQDRIIQRLRERGENVPDLNSVAVTDPVGGVEFMFPHYFMLPVFTSMASYRVRPLGPESCFFEIWSLSHMAPDQQTEVPMEPTVLAHDDKGFPPIPQQDFSNIPLQQRGLHTKGFEFMRLSKHVEGLISNYNRILDGYLQEIPLDKLARSTHELGGNFDGPIKDLGLEEANGRPGR